MYLPIVAYNPKEVKKLATNYTLATQMIDLDELRSKKLRPVPASELPWVLGGDRATEENTGSELKSELIRTAGIFHDKLRPKLVKVMPRPAAGIKEELWSQFDWESGTWNRNRESPMRPKYALDQVIQSHPGWTRLQEEVRCRKGTSCLLPVVTSNDFYIIRSSKLPV